MHSSTLFSDPIVVHRPDECTFYHSLDLPSFGSVRGHWDLRGRFDDYTGHCSWNGKSMLDVGTASGFLSFEAEKRGARVVSFDIDDARSVNALAFPANPRQREREQWIAQTNTRIGMVHKSYWLAHRDFQSRNKVCYGSAYAIPSELGMFDVVVVGQILVHLADIIRALEQVAARCAGSLVVTEGMLDNEHDALSRFLGNPSRPNLQSSFWHHSIAFYIRYLGILGFKLDRKSVGRYTCNIDPNEQGILTTLVFNRE
jgi:SAM-dependent methyltransferase